MLALSPLDSILCHIKRAVGCDWMWHTLGCNRKESCKAPFVLVLLAIRRKENFTKSLFSSSIFLKHLNTRPSLEHIGKGIAPEDTQPRIKNSSRGGRQILHVIKNILESRAAEICKVYCTAMSPYLLMHLKCSLSACFSSAVNLFCHSEICK